LYARRTLDALLGRDDILAELRAAWQHARSGAARGALLLGEPGIGKSRLVRSLLDAIGSDDPCIIALFCTAPARNNPFQPWDEPLRLMAGIEEDAGADEIRAGMVGLGARLALTNEDAAGLAALLGAPLPGSSTAAAIRRQIFGAVGALLDRLGRDSPLLVIAEDVHWADPSTLELLGDLVAPGSNRPLFLIATSRTGSGDPWPERADIGRLAISPLPEPMAEALAAEYAATLGIILDDQMRAAVAAQSEGVPLFIEEFVRALADRDAPRTRLPGSIAQLLVARLDALGEARSLAQVASVVGREVPIDLLARLSDIPVAQFEDRVGRLVAGGVMVRRGPVSNAILAFQHVLLADTAYQSMQSELRRALHARVAETMRVGGRNDAATLARHYGAAGNGREAAEFYRDAAVSAHSSGAFVETEAHARAAVALLDELPAAETGSLLLPVLNVLGEALIATRGYADKDVQATFERGARIALGTDSAAAVLPALRGLASFYQVRGPLLRAQQLSERVLQIARRINEPLLLAQSERRHGWCRLCQGEIAEAKALLDSALARELASAQSEGALAYDDVATLGILSWVDWLTLGPEAALARAATTAARAELSPRPLSVAYAFGFVAFAHQLAGDAAGARRFAER
ncbi:MAG: AAA family ATPase, partial [Acetobacteraceae bacterium]